MFETQDFLDPAAPLPWNGSLLLMGMGMVMGVLFLMSMPLSWDGSLLIMGMGMVMVMFCCTPNVGWLTIANANGNGNVGIEVNVDVNAPTVGWLTIANENGNVNVNGNVCSVSLPSFACDGQCFGKIRRDVQVGSREKTMCNPNSWNMHLVVIIERKGAVTNFIF